MYTAADYDVQRHLRVCVYVIGGHFEHFYICQLDEVSAKLVEIWKICFFVIK